MRLSMLVLFLLASLEGVGQDWQLLPCSELPNHWPCEEYADVDTIDPVHDSLLFSVDSSGLWQYGHSHKIEFDSVSVFQGWMTDTLNHYGMSDSVWFEVKFRNAFSTTWIYFEHKFQTDTLNDVGYISYSCDGSNWRILNGMYEPNPNNWFPEEILYANYLGIPEEEPPLVNDSMAVFSGHSSDWHWTGAMIVWATPRAQGNESRDSDGCIWGSDSIRFRFNFNTDSIEDNLGGWMIRKLIIGHTALGGSVSETDYLPLDVYPNPTTSTLRIQLPDGNLSASQTRLYDMTGRLVLQQPFNPVADVSVLDTGSYILVVETEQGRFRNVIQKE